MVYKLITVKTLSNRLTHNKFYTIQPKAIGIYMLVHKTWDFASQRTQPQPLKKNGF